MRKITFSEATREAMAEEMEKYPEVFVMGEDLARQGGIFGQFKGLPDEFPGRVIDTPISETFIVGGGVGAALGGARPVVDMHFADFIGVCMDEVLNQMAKIRYMFGGQAKIPLVLRAPDGLAGGGAAQHSQSVESFFIHIPGIKVVAPSNPYDAKMVLKAAIECDDPVLYFENKVLYKETGEVPEKEDEVPYEIGKARVEREGKDVTIVSYSIGMKNARAAADQLAKDGIQAEGQGDRTELREEDPSPLPGVRMCQAGRCVGGSCGNGCGRSTGIPRCADSALRCSVYADPLRPHTGEALQSLSRRSGQRHQGRAVRQPGKENEIWQLKY